MVLVALVVTISIVHYSQLVHASALPSLHSLYTTSHSLGDSYVFEPRDGWSSVNVSDAFYNYRRDLQPTLKGVKTESKRHSKDAKHRKSKERNPKESPKLHSESLLDPSSGPGGEHFQVSGDSQPVTITWYTGNDLQNPSCWLNTVWTPTDESFVCAVTLEGWTDRPQCFKFLELCHGPKKCVFVRVVDTCAGCAKGSRHVDLTKAAFAALSDLDAGRIEDVQMRPALLPFLETVWPIDLWGPQVPK
ncbi:hypothetical protein E1B28_004457 [Marasmius oreades]|uniref:RlpA-like protein double-psi beta-barrel domain-containing protein n=1 Tax=Marasmius oreades TaxID=181124 RepID=A0A9P7UYQ7_9AGAR|nr:uncharacterized protein E1B28_004457 [Marasmius oreades]KAG7097070.1 hypothetical protein E1B28_004457 [Marasmius oreades]